MQEQIFIESPRLFIRSWKASDIIDYIKMNQDPMVMKYFPKTLSTQETLNHFHKIQAHFIEFNYGLFALELKEENRFVGFTGLSHPQFNSFFTPCVEIGWRIDSAHWQKGIATEAANACLDFGFKNLNLEKIVSYTSIHNLASEKVMQKISMKKLTEFDHPNLETNHYLCKHVLYEINRTNK